MMRRSSLSILFILSGILVILIYRHDLESSQAHCPIMCNLSCAIFVDLIAFLSTKVLHPTVKSIRNKCFFFSFLMLDYHYKMTSTQLKYYSFYKFKPIVDPPLGLG